MEKFQFHFRGRYLGIAEREGWEFASRTNASNVAVLVPVTDEREIILVEQYFDFAYDLADRFIVLRRGEVLINGTREDVTRDKLLQAVTV